MPLIAVNCAVAWANLNVRCGGTGSLNNYKPARRRGEIGRSPGDGYSDKSTDYGKELGNGLKIGDSTEEGELETVENGDGVDKRQDDGSDVPGVNEPPPVPLDEGPTYCCQGNSRRFLHCPFGIYTEEDCELYPHICGECANIR